MIIQGLLVLVAVVLLAKVAASDASHTIKAGQKLIAVLLVVLMVVAVMYPELVSMIAQSVGIGRGTDLLIYALCCVCLWYGFSRYANVQRERVVIDRIARRVAINDAIARYRLGR